MEVGLLATTEATDVAETIGLVPDELMLDVVKAELDRLKGKVS
jgi:hypothetical protein